jgi:glucose/arabinose dehydrogenase
VLSIRNRSVLAAIALLVGASLAGCAGERTPPPALVPPDPTTQSEPTIDERTESSAAPTDAPTDSLSDATQHAASFNPEQTQIDIRMVASDLNKPLFVTHAGDGSGRIFVVEQPGTIRIINEGQLLPEPFLDISDRVNDRSNEQGLLGLAFAPNFRETGAFFVNYTDANGDTIVARFQADPEDANRADANSEAAILTIAQPAGNHNGGMIAFGPDGYLYVGTGDGGAANDRFGNGQNPQSLLGKMLRIDVLTDPASPYTIPDDNPWVAADWAGQDVLDEVWAVGLRNPWRYSFDRVTGDLWIGDVGQNQYEEVNYIPAGTTPPLNFGWPIMEATHCFGRADCDQTGLWLPVAETDHRGNCSLTGGYVYRGQAFPELTGTYLFGDYCSGKIWATLPDPDAEQSDVLAVQNAKESDIAWRSVEVLDTALSINSFGEDEAGELYVIDHKGSISQIVIPESVND